MDDGGGWDGARTALCLRRALAGAAGALVVVLGPGAAAASADYTASVSPTVVREDAAFVVVTVRKEVVDTPRSITIAPRDGSAQTTTDFRAPTEKAVFGLNNVASIQVPIVNDATDEVDESFSIAFPDAPNAIAPLSVTIRDDDLPRVSVGDAADVPEGATATFPVSLSTPRAAPVTFEVAAVSAEAQAPDDFEPVRATLTFPPGETTLAVAVPTKQDALDEGDDTIGLVVGNPGGAGIGRGGGTARILDDDPTPSLMMIASEVPEGKRGGTAAIKYTLRLSAASGREVSVGYRAVPGTAIPSDFRATEGRVVFAPGDPDANILVPVVGDARDEEDETVTLQLFDPVNTTLARETATGTIWDDDGPGLVGADARPPQLTVTRLRLSGSRLSARLTCPRTEKRCAGRVTVYTRPSRRAKVRALRRETRVARTTFTLTGGSSRTVKMKLSASFRRLVRRAGKVPIAAFTVTRDASGNVSSKRVAATLKKP